MILDTPGFGFSAQIIMYPRQTPNAPNRGTYRLTLPSSPRQAASNLFEHPYSPYSVDQGPFPTQPHRLQPPPAPRLGNIPLPSLSPTYAHSQAPPFGGDVFPIDLTNEIDFSLLARGMLNFALPPRTTVYVLPASRDHSLLQVETGDRTASAFSVIRKLQSILNAPLSLQKYRTQLQPVIQESVRQYFLSESGYNGVQLWQGFLSGFEGPSGLVVLQGHSDLWGLSQDHSGQWIIHVDKPFTPGI
ncbi:hypothetical protein K438DRAFT_2018066 [Mycena galopus ATCC 62051]|nr:hypothetical protein K438DRAFT_2018066 [Mycena galopus ATCC 62051]